MENKEVFSHNSIFEAPQILNDKGSYVALTAEKDTIPDLEQEERENISTYEQDSASYSFSSGIDQEEPINKVRNKEEPSKDNDDVELNAIMIQMEANMAVESNDDEEMAQEITEEERIAQTKEMKSKLDVALDMLQLMNNLYTVVPVVSTLLLGIPISLLSTMNNAYWDSLQTAMSTNGCPERFQMEYFSFTNVAMSLTVLTLLIIYISIMYTISRPSECANPDAFVASVSSLKTLTLEEGFRVKRVICWIWWASLTTYITSFALQASLIMFLIILWKLVTVFSIPSALLCTRPIVNEETYKQLSKVFTALTAFSLSLFTDTLGLIEKLERFRKLQKVKHEHKKLKHKRRRSSLRPDQYEARPSILKLKPNDEMDEEDEKTKEDSYKRMNKKQDEIMEEIMAMPFYKLTKRSFAMNLTFGLWFIGYYAIIEAILSPYTYNSNPSLLFASNVTRVS